ncbi:spermidine synthase [Legionella fairfieldensis]|uniref:spermidine synthase n=1 Tax=Legionella fairfieldensis TaxID=45064 RepID=UPI00048F82BB|nr:spermidine synthase [Legionella fairfieldensis]
MVQVLFSITLFLSAFLLFTIQPMSAKLMLPVYGGTPAVWTICMLFFQGLLLVAYGYVWFLSRLAHPWFWRFLHLSLVLLSLIGFPLALSPFYEKGAPDLSLLTLLIKQAGLPLLIIASSAPLLQFVYSQTKAKQANDPYFLYVSSNVGSFLALVSYPWLIESYSGLNQQFYYWNVLFILYLLLLMVILLLPYWQSASFNHAKNNSFLSESTAQADRLPLLIRVRWLGFSFLPCSLMLGVTFYISTDIAATPLIWMLPLAFYLLSFIITFARKPVISQAWIRRNILFFLFFPLVGFIAGANALRAWELVIFHLTGFFMLALLCHGELVSIRPPVNRLTSFYFCIALGGGLAGLFNGLIAPRLFSGAYEYPIILSLAMLCITLPRVTGTRFTPFIVFSLLIVNYFLPNQGWTQWVKTNHIMEFLALGLILSQSTNRINLFTSMAILVIFLFSPWFGPLKTIGQQRNFYGIKQVIATPGAHALLSQSTLHGFQLQNDSILNNRAMAYYGPVLPVVQRLQRSHQSIRGTVLGLGTGMMSCQFRASDKLDMIDVDRQVIEIASNADFFTYIRDCPPAISLIEGDGRLILQKRKTVSELLVIDAFSSDAIPTHLLTLEAFKLYQQKISHEGVIMANVSNRHLHLLPVLTAAGRQLDLLVLHKLQPGNNKKGQFLAEWVLLTANEPLALELMRDEGWRFVAETKNQLWTDDYSNVVSLLKW